MNIFEPDEILGEKISDVEDLITQMINVQNEKNEINERELINVKILIETLRNNPHLLKFIQQKYMENLGLWLIQNASNILNAQYQKFYRDDSGRIILDDDLLLTRKHYGQGKMAEKWYIVNDREILLKNILEENLVENTLIAEEIARQLNLPVAIYFPARQKNSEKSNVITVNFLEQNEVLVEGNKICGSETDIIKVEKKLAEFLRKELSKKSSENGENNNTENVVENAQIEQKIKQIITNYKKFLLYSIFINHRDAHNGNWGLVKNIETGEYEFSSIYDLEGCLCENSHKIRVFCYNDEYDDDAILEYILNDEEVLRLAQKKDFLDINEVYQKIYKQKRVRISPELRQKNEIIIQEQKSIIRKHVLSKLRNSTEISQENKHSK